MALLETYKVLVVKLLVQAKWLDYCEFLLYFYEFLEHICLVI